MSTLQPSRSFVGYCRVSTAQQGRSGLGLEAQEAAIRAYLRPSDRLLSPLFVEVESGKVDERPELAKALEKCRKTGATLLVAKLDRLARNTRFLLSIVEGLGDAGVVFLDLPDLPAGAVGRFLLTQMAAVAELERGLTSTRTKAALASAKARGVKLGGWRGNAASKLDATTGAKAATEARKLAADRSAHGVLPAVEELRAEGVVSLAGIAAGLTARGILTPRGGAWTATGVRRVLERVEEAA